MASRVAIQSLRPRARMLNLQPPSSSVSFAALIMGPPGGGKGTISKKILKDFPFDHLSTGDILRQHVRDGTALGKEVEGVLSSGGLVPDALIVKLVLEEVSNRGSNRLLLDGFPRTVAQASELGRHIKVDLALNLDVPTETIVARISGRWIHTGSGRVYAYDYNPPKKEGIDDETGEALMQRDDDKAEAVRTRLAAYNASAAPLASHYEQQGLLKTFSGTESDVIYPMVQAHLESLGL